MAFQDFVEARPADDALAISPRQPLLPYPHHLMGEPSHALAQALKVILDRAYGKPPQSQDVNLNGDLHIEFMRGSSPSR